MGNPLIETVPSIGDPLSMLVSSWLSCPIRESDRQLSRMERLNKLPYIKQLHVLRVRDTERLP